KDRMFVPQLDELLREFHQLFLLVVALPRKPVQLVVLTIGVIVSLLGSREFVAAQKHRDTLRQKERRQKIPALPASQFVDFWIVGRSFRAAVPRVVIVV